MDVPSWEILAIGAALLGSFFFSGVEAALTSLSEARSQQLLDESDDPRHPLLLWVRQPQRVLSTLLFGNTLANIAASAIATDLVLRTGTRYAVAIAIGATTLVVVSLCAVIPRTLARRHAVEVALVSLRIVALLSWVFFPITWVLLRLTNGLARLFGERPTEDPAVTGAEIEYLINLGGKAGVLDDVKKQLLSSVIEFADLLVKEIMVPRTRMIGIEKDASFDEALRIVAESEHSRIPIYEGSIDNVVGVLFVKDLAADLQRGGLSAQNFRIEKYARPPFFIPELMKVSRLLREFQRRKTHMAVVVDEFGGISGLVTLEDVVEEIVGEIQDEYDVEEKPVKALPDGRFVADGSASLRDVESALGVEFPEEGDYETLGGFLTAASGKVPATGSTVAWNGLTFVIRLADERRVCKVEISRMKEGGADTARQAPIDAASRGA